MSDDEPSAQLLERYRDGDDAAADEMFRRYVDRLLRLVQSRLAARLASRTDAEDVVLSAYRSFFVAVRKGRFSIHRGGDLWRLLASITLHKLYRQVEHHTAEKRDVRRQSTVDLCRMLDCHPSGQWPTAEQAAVVLAELRRAEPAAVVADEIESLARRISPLAGNVLWLRLQGFKLEEIAAQTERSERTVRRVLEQIRAALENDA